MFFYTSTRLQIRFRSSTWLSNSFRSAAWLSQGPTLPFLGRWREKKRMGGGDDHINNSHHCFIKVYSGILLLVRLLLVRLGGYIVNLSEFYSYRLIGKLNSFFEVSGVLSAQSDRGFFHYLRTTFSSMIKSRFGNILDKTVTLRINLNIDGTPITSKSHTHPSLSQTSRLLTSSLSLGVPVPRPTQCLRDVYIPPF